MLAGWRSIPVRTGEPGMATPLGKVATVYPRAYGGTVGHGARGCRSARSIPVRTGEPEHGPW